MFNATATVAMPSCFKQEGTVGLLLGVNFQLERASLKEGLAAFGADELEALEVEQTFKNAKWRAVRQDEQNQSVLDVVTVAEDVAYAQITIKY